jgi:hypothetical protein
MTGVSPRWAHLAVPEGVELRNIPGFPDKYIAGSDGHVYCLSDAPNRANRPRPFRMSEFVSKQTRYPTVVLINKRKASQSYCVHALVCRAFHGPKPTPAHEVRHLDGTRDNNKPDNLCWGTAAENEADKRRHGRVAWGSRHGIAKLNEEAVRILRVAIPRGLWNYVDAAKVFGVETTTLMAAVKGHSWKHVELLQPGEVSRG